MSLSGELISGHFTVGSTIQMIRHNPLADDLEKGHACQVVENKQIKWSVFFSQSLYVLRMARLAFGKLVVFE